VTVCKGCGGPLPPPSLLGGRPRLWCSGKCRKASYGDPCVDCGARTVFGAERARVDEPRCYPCSTAHRTVWTREALIAAIQRWAQEHGEPPAVADWNPTVARRMNDPERAARAGRRQERQTAEWPHPISVIRRFGSWSNGLEAAGFTPRAPHGGGGNELCKRSVREKAL